MGRLSPAASWAVLVGGSVAARLLGPLWWLYLVVVLVTWTAEPLSNLLLRLDRYGRVLLSREEVVASNWLGATLGVAAATGLAGLAAGSATLAGAGLATAVLAIPVAAVAGCDKGWPRRTMTAYAAACALLIATGVALSAGGHDHAHVVVLAGAVAAAAGSWVGTVLMRRSVRH